MLDGGGVGRGRMNNADEGSKIKCIGRLFQRRGKKALSTLVFRQEFGTDSLVVNERKILKA